MGFRKRIFTLFYAFIIVVAAGIIGYMVIEGWSFIDALYMTVITISTVGYNEIYGLSAPGRLFTIFLIIGGVGVMFYGATTIVQHLLEGQFGNVLGRRRMKDKIGNLKGHIILCGYRRVGREVAAVFRSENIPFVVIDVDRDAIRQAAAHVDRMRLLDGCGSRED